MIRKVNNNKFGVIEYAIDTEEDLRELPKEDTNNTNYAILRKGSKNLIYLYSKELKDYILINAELENINEQLEHITQQIANIEENGTGGGNCNITVDGIEGGIMDINTTNTFELKVADDLSYSNNILKLMSNGVPFGNGVTISINEGSSGDSSETNPYTKLYDYTLTEDSTDIKIGTDGLNIKEFKIYVLLTNQDRASTYGYLKVNGVNSAFMGSIVDDKTTSIQSFSFEISELNDIKEYVIRRKYPLSNWNSIINSSCPKWWSGETITSLYVETYNSSYPILANSRIIIYGR